MKLVLQRVAPAQPVAQSAAPAAKLARHPASVPSAACMYCKCIHMQSMSMKYRNFMEFLCLAQLSSRCL